MRQMNSFNYMVQKIQGSVPSMRYDFTEEFGDWQAKAREKLMELLGLPFELCEDQLEITAQEECDTYIKIDFNYQSEEGYYVPCGMLVPKEGKNPRPVAICLQGHSTGMHISLGIEKYPGDAKTIAGGRDFALRAVKEGFCAVVMEQRYMGVAGGNDNGAPACCRNAALPSLLVGRTAIGERAWDVMRLIDVLEKHFAKYVDKDRIILMGNSGGGTATFYTACVEPRIYLAMPSCAVCEYEDSIVPIYHCCCNYVPGIRKYFEMGDLGGLIAPRKFVQVNGVKDDIFPLHGVEKSHNRIKSMYAHIGLEDQCRLVKGAQGHQFYPDDAWPVVHELMK